MTKEELIIDMCGIHPDGLDLEIKRLIPFIAEYKREKEKALQHYENASDGLFDVQRKIDVLRAAKSAWKESK